MGLSLRPLKKVWETITPVNEEALRRNNAAMANATQRIQANPQGVFKQPGAIESFQQDNQPVKFDAVKSVIGATADTFTRPDVIAQAPRVNLGSWKGSGLAEDFINSPFKVTEGAVNIGQGNIKKGAGQLVSGAIEGPLGLVPIGRAASAGAKGLTTGAKALQGLKMGAREGGIYGAAYGGANAAAQDGSLKDIALGGAVGGTIGAATGGALGGATPLAAAGAKAGYQAAKPVVTKTAAGVQRGVTRLDDKAFTPRGTSRIPQEERNMLRDYGSMVQGDYRPPAAMMNELHQQVRGIGKRAGIDVSTGSPREIADRVNTFVDNLETSKQGGYIGRGKAPAPQAALSPEEKTIQQIMTESNLPRARAEAEYKRLLGESTAPNQTLKSKPQVSLRGTGNTVGDRANQLYEAAGIDTNKGLVRENPLYTKTGIGAAQQGYNRLVNKARDTTSDKIRSGIDSPNAITSKASALPNIAFANIGQKDSVRAIGRQRSSDVENAGQVASTLLKKLNKDATPQEFERIYRVLEEPDFLERKYGDGTKLTPDDLTPQERSKFDQLIEFNKVRNDINLENGLISPEKHAQYADGLHSPRIYDQDIFGKSTAQGGLFDNSAANQRTDVNAVAEDIFETNLDNPYQASMLRLESALRNKSNFDALQGYERSGMMKDTAPNSNYVPLEGKRYGRFEGKFLDKQLKSQIDNKQIFNSKIGQAAGDLIESYQQTKLGKLDRLNKATKTVLSPATNLGNIGSNLFAFAGAAGVNPAAAGTRMAQAAKQLAKHNKEFDPNVNRALKAGLFTGDTGRQINGKKGDAALKTAGKSKFQKIKDAPGDFYGGTDKAFTLGLFNELKSRGLSDKEAVRRAQLASQNYENAGRGIQLFADSPVLGKPFARFTPELIRIMKNSAVYNPVGTTAKIGGLAYGANKLSELAGETQEERDARENAVGQTQLPATSGINKFITGNDKVGNVSLNLPVGNSAVNIARLTGLNYPIEPNSDANSAVLRQLSPVADLTRKTADGKEVFAPNQAVSSLTFRPIADQLANRDFMGRQITDPDNAVRSEIGKGKSEYENADGTRQGPGKGSEKDNRIRALKAAYLPGFNEFDANRAAASGQKDYYGKERTQSQAILRAVGLKTENNDPKAREKRVDTKNFFEGKDAQVKGFLRDNPQLADQYFRFNDSSRDRFSNKKSSDLVTPEKWRIIQGETSGKLFSQLKQEALDSQKRDGSLVDPVYQIEDSKRLKDVLTVRSANPGENIEKEEILRATTSWYPAFEKAERDFYDKLDKQPKKAGANPPLPNDRVKAWKDVPYTEQTPLRKQYLTLRYGNEEQGIPANVEAGKAFFKANADQLNADRKGYETGRLAEINGKRAIMGLDPIDQDTFNNVTFGFNADEEAVLKELRGKGVGSGGGGKKYDSSLDTYKYAVTAKGKKVSTGKAKVGKANNTRVARKVKKAGKPRVVRKNV